METLMPNRWVEKGIDPLSYTTEKNAIMPPKYVFTSTLEAEFFLKGSLLWEMAVEEDERTTTFNDYWRWDANEASTVLVSAPEGHWIFVMEILWDEDERFIEMPTEGDFANVIFTKSEKIHDSYSDNNYPYGDNSEEEVWRGVVIGDPSFSSSYNLAIMV
ncbi:hypothetical protein HYALB_00007423 [Hymenoscyphus albidus]|uniref:Uncharacterized protein n=1 Tax=Hymenoscyphus albidus TaxID=595503 RepID=A0A9N9LZ79_9HELO|nr:hypothetical protein HYALB_00007423 [Hymenoscyphus albidus]